MSAESKWLLNVEELLTRMKVRIAFSLLELGHTANSLYNKRACLSCTLESITNVRGLAGINFHNIWQVDTPREETDLASGDDHPRFVLHTSLRNKCHRSDDYYYEITIYNLKLIHTSYSLLILFIYLFFFYFKQGKTIFRKKYTAYNWKIYRKHIIIFFSKNVEALIIILKLEMIEKGASRKLNFVELKY